MKVHSLALVFVSSLFLSSVATAQQGMIFNPDKKPGEETLSSCDDCHGPQAQAVPPADFLNTDTRNIRQQDKRFKFQSIKI